MKDDRLMEMRTFVAVVEHGGFSSAAVALEVSQPLVSRTIARLETRLGIRLLYRSTRGQRLTDEGRQYFDACTRIVSDLEQAEQAVSISKNSATGDLRISMPIAFGTDQILPLLPEYLRNNPHMRLHVSMTDAMTNLIEDHIDLAIRMGRLERSTPSLVARKLCSLQRILVASPLYVDERGCPTTPYDLLKHNCLEWQGEHDHLNLWRFKVEDRIVEIRAKGNVRSSNGLSLSEMCLAGVGIMRMAEHLAVPAIRQGRLVSLLDGCGHDDRTAVHAIYPPESKFLPRVRLFVEHLIDSFRQPPWLSINGGDPAT